MRRSEAAASSNSLVVVGSIYLLTSFGDETLFPERWRNPSRQKNATVLIWRCTSLSRYLSTYLYPTVTAKISLEWRMYTPVWNVILSILRSQMEFFTMEMILGFQKWQDHISNVCVYILHSSEICSVTGKNRLTSIWTMIGS